MSVTLINPFEEWESPQAFQAAVGGEQFREMTKGAPPGSPALYEVVRSM